MRSLLKIYVLILALIAWFGLALQFYLSIKLINEYSATKNIVHYFSYFTILTNLMVAFTCSAALVKKPSRFMIYFTDFRVVSAVTSYILFVGIIYQIALSAVWNPQGWQLLADILLHYITPAMFFLYWIFIIKRGKLKLKQAFIWLLYPFAYFVYAVTLGKMTGFYPYYFINVKHIGYTKLAQNFMWLLLAFLVMGILLIGINNIANRLSKTSI